MALIKCWNCEKEISDKAPICPNCGAERKNEEQIEKIVKCNECGTEIKEDQTVCSICGCPIISEDENIENEVGEKKALNKKKKIIIIIVSLLVAISAIVGGVVAYNSYKEKKELEEYQNNLELTVISMLNGAVDAEKAGSLIHDVWYNTIYEEHDPITDKFTLSIYGTFNKDINDSLNKLYKDLDFKVIIYRLEDNQETVEMFMKDMINPPEEYAEAYQELKKCYDAYLEFTNLVISPNGSLKTFTSAYNEADSNFTKAYQSMKVYREE